MNRASQTLSRSHREVCQYADLDKLKTQRLNVRNFIHGLKVELDGLVTDLNNDEIGSASTRRDIINTQINNSISNVVNGVETGFFPTTDKNIDDICQQKDDCSINDFNNQGSTNYIPDRVIKCRVKYKLVGENQLVKRDFYEKLKLKKYLETVNTLRRTFPGTYGLRTGRRTFGFIIVDNISTNKTQVYPLDIDIKGISGSDSDVLGYAPIIKDKDQNNNKIKMYPQDVNGRVFTVQNFGGNDRGNDTEVRMLEEIARIYFKHNTNTNNPRKVNLELFTDRETCGGCETLIDRINSGKEQTAYSITINPVLQGVFQASTLSNPNREAEVIPQEPQDFYMNIN